MTSARRKAFTLIELLVVISIIALLISLLLPALGQAREQVIAVKCAAQERQMGIALFLYTDDSEAEFPPGKDNAHFPAVEKWSANLNNYVQNEDVFKCPSRIAPGNFMGYRANGVHWMVWADWLVPTHTRIDQVRSPSQLVFVNEDMEDLANPNVRFQPDPLRGMNWSPNVHYSRYNGCCEARNNGGRHFTNGTPAAAYWDDITQTTGQDNTLFVDGHVSMVDMTPVIASEGTQQAFYSYPWGTGSFYDLTGFVPSPKWQRSAPAGAEWWRVPWW